MVAAPRGRLGHILRAFQSEALAHIEQPDEEAVLRVKEYLVQCLVCFVSGSHRELAVRQLKDGVHLEARGAAQQILGGNAAGMDIAGGRNRQPLTCTSRLSTVGLERQEPLQSSQIPAAQVGSAVGHPDFALKLLGGVKQPIGVSQEVGALFARRSGLDRVEHAKLEFVLEEGVENLE